MFFFFFFKQKTAYEMRISDWSSDMCSSDLTEDFAFWIQWGNLRAFVLSAYDQASLGSRLSACGQFRHYWHGIRRANAVNRSDCCAPADGSAYKKDPGRAVTGVRSEEHTSELQSLMRISYAVFCLQKKKKHTNK